MARLLPIGLDGATFDLIGPWAQSGLLPHLFHLMRERTWGSWRQPFPP